MLVSLPFKTYVACNSKSTVFAGPQSQSLDLHCTQVQVASQHVRSTLLVWSAKAYYTQLPSSLLPDRLRISSSEPTALSAGLLRSEISGVACLATFRCRKPEITWLRTPFRHEGRWGLNRELLIPGRMVHYWTGHSARHTLDIGKEKRDFLGRWAYSQHGSQDYVLTSRQVVHAIQNYVCKSLIVGGYIEEEVLSDLEVYAKTCGLGAESLGGHHVLRWDGVQRPWALGGTFPAFQVAGHNRAEAAGDLDAETKEPFNKIVRY